MDEREARRALACVVEAGDPRIGSLVDRFGAVDVWRKLREGGSDHPWSRRAAVLELRTVDLLERRHAVRFVVPEDPEWPHGLADLALFEGVQDLGGVPLGLWVRGERSLAEAVGDSIAIVGSRASTAYGDRVAGDIAAGLAIERVTVVSGAAYGIDAAAHRGALAEQGATVAVVAGGVDEPYPPSHRALLASIAERGAVVSEQHPGEHPTRRRFLARNRLIASMTRGTVIVEAAARSGARNTVTWASGCGRPVMAVPGPVGNGTSYTPHLLIREGLAVLVTRAEEVRELVGRLGSVPEPARPPVERLLDALAGDQLSVYEALPSRGARDVGDIALRAGVAVPRCLGILGELRALELVQSTADGRWRLGRVADRPVLTSERRLTAEGDELSGRAG